MTQIVQGIYLPDRDIHFAKHIRNGPLIDGKGTYQLSKIRAALGVSHRRGFAIDVGAQVGLWTRILALNFDIVVAFEPIPSHIECLEKNLSSFIYVEIERVALGNQSGLLAMKEYDDIATASVCCSGDRGEFEVPVKRLDDFNFKRVDFIKIDTEGYEAMILRGGEETIRRDLPTIVIEQKKRRVAQFENDHLAGVHLLQSWGANIQWKMSGDFCMGWIK